jgi:hypothetical protein
MKDFVSRVQRELPDTDQDRYDIAYERGRAQARSGLLFGGLALGSSLGAALMWLFDPERGKGRRAELASRTEGLRNDLSRTLSGRVKDLQNRAQGFAIERGIKEPPTDGDATRTEVLARPSDASRPGSRVEDPVTPAEVAVFGPSGPGAGAASDYEESEERLAGR